MLTVAVPKRNKLQNIIVLTPKDGSAYEKRFMKKTRIFVDISFDYTQKIS